MPQRRVQHQEWWPRRRPNPCAARGVRWTRGLRLQRFDRTPNDRVSPPQLDWRQCLDGVRLIRGARVPPRTVGGCRTWPLGAGRHRPASGGATGAPRRKRSDRAPHGPPSGDPCASTDHLGPPPSCAHCASRSSHRFGMACRGTSHPRRAASRGCARVPRR